MLAMDRKWIEEHFNDLRKELVLVQIEIAKLKVKSGIWGVIGGSIPVLMGLLIYIIV
jgi:hypothetical protein